MSISIVMDDMDTAQIRTEAEHWFARLRAPDCDASQRKAFEHWRQHPAHAEAYARTERLWAELAGLAAVPEMQRRSRQVLTQGAARQVAGRRRRTSWAMAATVLLTFAVAGVYGWQLRPAGMETVIHASAAGQTRAVVLEDGSRLTLNTDSEVAVRMSSTLRQLELRRGEALFDVHHDAARPFVVVAGAGEVRALGTRFQVRREPGDVTVTLLQGRVRVARTTDGLSETLQPGDQLRYAGQGAMARQRVDPNIVSSWTRGRLIFRATPLAQALAEVNRYAQPSLRVEDPALADAVISGSIKVGDGALMAAAVSQLMNLQLQQQADGSILLHR